MTELLTIRQAAKRIKIGYNALRLHVKAGAVRVVQLPGRAFPLIDPQDLEAFVAASKVGPELGPTEEKRTVELSEELAREEQGRKPENLYDVGWQHRVTRK